MSDVCGVSVSHDARKELRCVDMVFFTELCNSWNLSGATE